MELLIQDEIAGSKKDGCLPVLKVVECAYGHRKFKGIVKRYIPYKVTDNETPWQGWDSKASNFGKDSRGRIYRIDTQTNAATMIGI